jgi:hypothetical protein
MNYLLDINACIALINQDDLPVSTSSPRLQAIQGNAKQFRR